jgi:hypothetical protein
VADAADRDPVNVLGELIEDAAIRHGGTIGTVASAHVAEEVIKRLRSDPALAAAVLGGVDLDPRTATLTEVILPWVVAPTSGHSPDNGAPWTPDERAAWDATEGWGPGIAAIRRVRAERIARDVLAFLDSPGHAAGDTEWGIQDEAGDLVMPVPGGRYTEAAARRNLLPGDVLVRRRPAGPWEPAPDTPATRKPANPPRGPSGASPSADGTAR